MLEIVPFMLFPRKDLEKGRLTRATARSNGPPQTKACGRKRKAGDYTGCGSMEIIVLDGFNGVTYREVRAVSEESSEVKSP